MSARILTAILATTLCLLAAAPLASAAAPAFKLSTLSEPTNFVLGSDATAAGAAGDSTSGPARAKPQYSVTVTNVGSAATDEGDPIIISDTLPEGVTPVLTRARFAAEPNNEAPLCDISGQTVHCTLPISLQPGQWAQVLIGVKVDLGAPPSVVNQAAVTGGGAVEVSRATTTTISSSLPSFDFLAGPEGLGAAISGPEGEPATQAGSHPYQLTFDVGFPTSETDASPPGSGGLISSGGHLRNLSVVAPRGLIADPGAIPVRCTEAQLLTGLCPLASEIGRIVVLTEFSQGVLPVPSRIYNMVPPRGEAAEFAFEAVPPSGAFTHTFGRVNSAGEYQLTSDTQNILARQLNPVFGAQVHLWGTPSDASHDGVRGSCAGNESPGCVEPTERTEAPFLALPSSCRPSLSIEATAESWEEPSRGVSRSAEIEELSTGAPTGTEGCNALEFEPTIEARPTTNLAESPSGLDFNLHQRQNLELEDLATSPVKDITVALPEGMTLNPAAADGLAGCSATQIGLTTAIGQSPARFSEDLPACPAASKLGTLEVRSPALAKYDEDNKIELDSEGNRILDPVSGSIYLAEPFDNPFDSLLAIYLAVEDEKTGIVAKVPAEVTADPKTGQLVTRITNNPELPLEDVDVRLFGGARGPLITPPLCGNHTTTSAMTPWSTPEGADAHPSDSFATTTAPGGGNCPTSLGQAPNKPSFDAGTIAPVAGAYSPFVLKLNRDDGTQRLTGVEATLPPGLIGKLAGLTLCSEAQLAAAKAREGAPNQGIVEQASPSCPASSGVGVVDVSAGAGPTPLYVKGKAYLAGPYKGAPLSLAVITPAVAGPFDLGAVTIRVALNLDPQKAQIRAVSDPFPTVIEGITLDVRGATLKMDRPQFTLNPTNCDPMAIEAIASTVPGGLATLRSPFQVGGCSSLGFKPKLAFQLKGGNKRGDNPALIATYRPKPGNANLKGLVVRLPRSAFLDQAHIRTICTRVQFAAEACPKGAQYGYIEAFTPLLGEPLQGPVWLRSSNNKLPDLVFDLHGIVDVEVATRIDSVKGGIRASIEASPDAPLTKVVLRMQGAKKGLIVNSRNLCGAKSKAGVEFEGHNGKASSAKPVMRADCGKKRDRKG